MALPDVFVPSSGDLIVRDNLSAGAGQTADHLVGRERPATMGGHRFGQLSHHSFFTRHNPQPRRVFHMKGLLDAPICTVNDNGVANVAAYSLSFPPNGHNDTVLRRLPVEAINVNSSLHPINTITGMQYFTGLKSYPFKEQFKPIGTETLDPESWRSFLKSIGEACGMQTPTDTILESAAEPKRPLYSAQTGRLIPPPSRATSRGFSRRRSRTVPQQLYPSSSHLDLNGLTDESEIETTVLRMLCQILQTEDVGSVKTWLASAGDAEKNIVVNLLRTAMAAKKDYYSRNSSADQQQQQTGGEPDSGLVFDHATQTIDEELIGSQPQNRLDALTGQEMCGDRDGQKSGCRTSAAKLARAKETNQCAEETLSTSLLDLKRQTSSATRKCEDVSGAPSMDVFQSKTTLPEIQKPRTPGRLRYNKSGGGGGAGGAFSEGLAAAAAGAAGGWGRNWLQDSSTP